MFVAAATTLLLCALFVAVVPSVRGDPVFPHLLQRTNVTCATTADCLAHHNRSWCHSGQVCLRGVCHRLPEYPCAHTDHCDAQNRTCVPRQCRMARDCDDHIFCNGQELCVNATCRVDPRSDCSRGFCSEVNRSCHMPRVLASHNARIVQQLYKSPRSVYTTTTTLDYHAQNATPAPTAEDNTLSDGAQIAIICAASVVFAAILILLIIALVSR